MKLKFGNVKELLDKLKPEMLDNARKVLAEGADEVAADARSRVPVKTGVLRDSITTKVVGEGDTIFITANAKRKGVAYGRIVEFSPVINEPFMYPALDVNRDRIRENVANAIKEAANNV